MTSTDGTQRVPETDLNRGQCRAWDGTELVCDLPMGHPPALPRDHRGHVLIDGRGPFNTVLFDADRRREPVREIPGPEPEVAGAFDVPPRFAGVTPGDPEVPPVDRQWATVTPLRDDPPKPRKRKLRVPIAGDFPRTIEGHLAAIARLSSAANGAGVPITRAEMKLVLTLGGQVRAAWFRWEDPA